MELRQKARETNEKEGIEKKEYKERGKEKIFVRRERKEEEVKYSRQTKRERRKRSEKEKRKSKGKRKRY
jgi:hypothetical protein